MTTKWAHLSNAVHIDRVIASVKANPDEWAIVTVAHWEDARVAAWNILKEQGRYSVWLAVQNEARDALHGWPRDAVQNESWYLARDAFLVLVAYDDCAYMLDSDPGELAILAKFGDPRAVLLLSACKAFHSLKELS